MLRSLLWRLLGLLALVVGFTLVAWLLGGGPGRLLRGKPADNAGRILARLPGLAVTAARSMWSWSPAGGVRPLAMALLASVVFLAGLLSVRLLARNRRRYVRLRIEPHRTDQAGVEAISRLFDVVQFLDGPGGGAGDRDGGDASGEDESRELVGVGADELDVTF